MTDRKGLALLRQITGDPSYVDRVSGVDSQRTTGRQWDNRFSASASGIPKYDALNDRFCKFAMRRHLATQRSSMKKPGLAGQLEPLAPSQQRRLWGTQDMPEAPRGGSQDPTSFRGAQTASGQPKLAAADQASAANIEALFSKSKQRLQRLWEELATPDNQRASFAQQFLNVPTTENLATINDEIQRLLDERNGAVQIEKAIEIREGFLYLLQELTERYANSSMEKDRAIRELQALVTPYRNSTLEAIEAIVRWRELIHQEHQPYLWKGVSYLHKINSDLFFLAQSRLRSLLDFEPSNNPLLDPRRTLSADKLPPLRRGATGVVSKEAAALKDLPKDRIDRADMVLQEEARRQRALMAPRPEAVLTPDEAAHMRALLTEQQERDQLVVEEENWQRAQTQAKSTEEIEASAATKIQAIYRAYTARRFVQAKLLQRKAAIKMQSIARQFLAKLHVETHRRQVEAAKRLQAVQRGIASRSRMAAVRHRHAAAITIQRHYRGFAARRLSDMLRYVTHCAIAIQRVYRGWRERTRVRSYVRSVQNAAATVIQKNWRGFQARRDPRNNRSIVSKTVKLQAWFRGCNTRRAVSNMVLVRYAATLIQSTWRGYAARKLATQRRIAKIDFLWKSHIAKATTATITIQSAWRMCQAKRFVSALRAEAAARRHAEAQAALRAAYQVDSQIRNTRNQAAIKIQSVVRGHQGRNRFRLLTLLHLTSIQIQRVVRGFLGRRRYAAFAKEQLIVRSLASIRQQELNEVSPVTAAVSMLRSQRDAEAAAMRPVEPNDVEVAKQLGLSESDSGTDAPAQSEPVAAVAVAPSTSAATPVTPAVQPQEAVAQEDAEVANTTATTPEDAAPLRPSTSRAATAEEIDISHNIIAAAERVLAAKSPEEKPQQKVEPPKAEPVVAAPAAVVVAAAPAADVPVVVPQTAAVSMYDEVAARRAAAAAEADKRRRHARDVVVRFFRVVAAVRAVTRARRTRRVTDRTARMQECEHAAVMIQRWIRVRLPIVAARRVARSVKQVQRSRASVKVNAQERNFAATIIQRNLMPVASARSIMSRMSAKRAASAKVKQALEQEQNTAAIMIQTLARAWLKRRAQQRLIESRRLRAAQHDAKQEKSFAAVHIQSAMRSFLARTERHRRVEVRRTNQSKQQENDAAAIIQVSARGYLQRRDATRAAASRAQEEARLAESVARERVHAARMIQSAARRKVLLPWRLAQRGQAEEAAAIAQETEYAAQLTTSDAATAETQDVVEVAPVVDTEGMSPAEAERLALEQEREYAANVIARNLSPTARTPERSPVRRSTTASTSDAPERTQEADFAATIIQPVGRGWMGRKTVARQRQHNTSSITVEGPFGATPLFSVVAVPAEKSAHLSQSRSGRARSVSFSGDAREHSRILREPELDKSADPDLGHEAAHVHDVNHGEPVQAAPAPAVQPEQQPAPAATAPVAAADSMMDVSNSSFSRNLHHVHFADQPAATETEVVAAPTASSTVVAAPLNEYEREKALKALQQKASRAIQSAERQRQARAELERRRAARGQQRALQRQVEIRAAEVAAEEEVRIARAEIDQVTLQRQTLAAIRIQCAVRIYNAKFMLKWMTARREEQRRNKAAADFTNLLNSSACRIQRMVRGALARMERKRRAKARDSNRNKAQTEQRRRERAAITMQCAYRSYNARFETAWRRRDAAAKAAALAAEREAAALTLEEAARRDRELLGKQTKSALVIQCAYRSYNARFAAFLRRQARDLAIATKLRDAAVGIQRVARGSQVRRHLSEEHLKAQNAKASADRARRLSEEKREVAREATSDAVDRATEARRMSQEKHDIARDATADAIDHALATDQNL